MKQIHTLKTGRKIISVLLTAALLFLLAACGSPQKDAAEAAAVTESTAIAETETAAAGKTADADETAAETGEMSPEKAAAAKPTGNSFGTFKTKDLAGNEVDESIFAQADYTMVNFWGTYCPPCIAEMPDLAELNEELPENMQMIGLICDLTYGQESERTQKEAEDILSSAGVTYTNLLIWPEAGTMISSFTAYVPTTFFVDPEGNVVGNPIIGADLDAYKDRIAALAK